MNKLLLAVAAYCALSQTAFAWDCEGHRVVAQIAYNHLDPAVKIKCDQLIGITPVLGDFNDTSFVTASCWADDIKMAAPQTKPQHYIDLPFSNDNTPFPPYATPALLDVVVAINQNVGTLQTSTIDIDRATALRFLIHFVGDIHQPLHCSDAYSSVDTGGDNGGNNFGLSNSGSLHTFWDQGGGYLQDSVSKPITTPEQGTLDAKVSEIETASPYMPHPGTIPDPMTWAQESFGLAKSVAYVGIVEDPNNRPTPSTDYTNRAQATTKQQLALGGHRLADLLNTILASKVPSIKSFSPVSGKIGAVVIITGLDFTGVTAVNFHGASAVSFTVDSDTHITATVPANATSGPITVTSSMGTSANNGGFAVYKNWWSWVWSRIFH